MNNVSKVSIPCNPGKLIQKQPSNVFYEKKTAFENLAKSAEIHLCHSLFVYKKETLLQL